MFVFSTISFEVLRTIVRLEIFLFFGIFVVHPPLQLACLLSAYIGQNCSPAYEIMIERGCIEC